MGQIDSGHLVQVQPAGLEAANGNAMSRATGFTRGPLKARVPVCWFLWTGFPRQLGLRSVCVVWDME